MVQGKYLDLACLKPAPMDMAKCIYASVRRYLSNRMHRTQWCLRMEDERMSDASGRRYLHSHMCRLADVRMREYLDRAGLKPATTDIN